MTKIFLCSGNTRFGSCCLVLSTRPAHLSCILKGTQLMCNKCTNKMCRSSVFCCRWIYAALRSLGSHLQQQGVLWSRMLKDVVWAADRGQPCDAEGQGTVPFLPVQLCLLRMHSSCGLVDAQRLSFLFWAFIFAGIWNSRTKAAE